MSAAHVPPAIVRPGQMGIHQTGKEAIGPIGVRAGI